MAISWTRIRQRNQPVVEKKQSFLFNEKYLQCWESFKLNYDGQLSKKLYNSEAIFDQYPYTKYKPGTFKISSVARAKLSQSTTPFRTNIIYGACGNGTRLYVGQGDYSWPIRFVPDESVPSIPYPVDSDANFHCRNALANAKTPTIGLNESLAEMGEVMRMLRSPLKSFRNFLKSAITSGKGKKRKLRTLQEASSAWLEARYGWYPLLMTIRDLILKAQVCHKQDIIYDSYARTKGVAITPIGSASYRVPNSRIYLTATGRHETTIKKTGRVYYYVKDAKSYDRLKLGFDLANLPALAYQLTKLSFAVDWFLDLGNYISALVPVPYISVLGYTYSERRTTRSVSSLLSAKHDYTAECQASGEFIQDKETYIRIVYDPIIPAIPKLDMTLSNLTHLADGLALLTQAIPKQYGNHWRR